MAVKDVFAAAAPAAAAPLVEIVSYDFTDCTSIDVSAIGTHAILKSDGATSLGSLVVSTDPGTGVIGGTNSQDFTNGSGLVLDVSSGGGLDTSVLAFALPTNLKAEFDVDYLMFEWLIGGVSMVGTNSYIKFHVSTTADIRGTPSNGLIVLKSASGYECKGSRQHGSSNTRSSGDATFSGGDLHVQLLMRRHSGVVYQGTGTAFADPYTLGISYGLGGRNQSATRPAGLNSAPQWTSPSAVVMLYCNTTGNEVRCTVKAFRICKFSPSV